MSMERSSAGQASRRRISSRSYARRSDSRLRVSGSAGAGRRWPALAGAAANPQAAALVAPLAPPKINCSLTVGNPQEYVGMAETVVLVAQERKEHGTRS